MSRLAVRGGAAAFGLLPAAASAAIGLGQSRATANALDQCPVALAHKEIDGLLVLEQQAGLPREVELGLNGGRLEQGEGQERRSHADEHSQSGVWAGGARIVWRSGFSVHPRPIRWVAKATESGLASIGVSHAVWTMPAMRFTSRSAVHLLALDGQPTRSLGRA